MPVASLGDISLAYEVAGEPEAEPVVLLNGCGAPAIGWFALVPMLTAAGYRVVTFETRGVAPSSCPPAPYAVADFVDDALGLCDHLGIEQGRFAGHSMGGWVAETLAIRHPDRVRAAVLMGSCNVATEWEKAITTVERDLARLDYDLPKLYYACETLRYLPNSQLQDDDVVSTWLSLIADNDVWPNPGRLGQYEACLAWSLDTERTRGWSTIRVPVLVMAFEHDIDSPPAHARAACAQIPGARYVEVPDASHIGPFTHPGAVGEHVVEFFATT